MLLSQISRQLAKIVNQLIDKEKFESGTSTTKKFVPKPLTEEEKITTENSNGVRLANEADALAKQMINLDIDLGDKLQQLQEQIKIKVKREEEIIEQMEEVAGQFKKEEGGESTFSPGSVRLLDSGETEMYGKVLTVKDLFFWLIAHVTGDDPPILLLLVLSYNL